jgi:O-antigen/teichoic acid export membrane protein
MVQQSAISRAGSALVNACFRNRSEFATKILKGGSWAIFGNFGSQFLRFVSNLWLTHLLFPAAFGLMAIAQSIMAAARLLSDIGLQQSVIRSSRGHDPEFLNSIWTLQILKGIGMFVVMWVVAGYAADAYQQPLLAQVIPGLGLAALISGFASTKMALLNRNIEMGRVIAMEMGTQIGGILVMGIWAWISPTPWALVAGNIFNSLAMTFATHVFLKGPRNRLAWDTSAVKEVWAFGGWVMFSSGVTFLVGEGRNLLNGKLVDSKTIGLMVISTTLVMVVWSAIQAVSGRVLFPAYSRVWRDRPEEIGRVIERARRLQLVGACAVAILFALFGRHVVHLFYDDRYRAAGAFIEIQAVGSIVGFLGGTYGGVLWAIGRPAISTFLLCGQLLLTVALIVGGHALGGTIGLVTGVSLVGVAMYPINSIVYARYGLFQPKTDWLPIVIAAVLGVYVYYFGAWTNTPL